MKGTQPHREKRRDLIELNSVINLPSGEELPEWICLVPAGDVITGRDGREYQNPGPEAIIRAQLDRGVDIPIDIEHATELKASKGEDAPALAWIHIGELEDRSGELWGKISWNARGAYTVAERSYRYYSPALVIESPANRILCVKSIGLTNSPNLRLPALNHEELGGEDLEKTPKNVLTALNLNAEATETEVLSAIATLKANQKVAANAQEDLVPKADYTLVLNRAETAEAQLTALNKQAFAAKVEAAVNQAVKDGKIAPSSKEYYTTSCNTEEALNRFNDFVKSSPTIVSANAEESPGKKPDGGKVELNDEQRAIAAQLGISVEDALKFFTEEEDT